MSKHSQQRAPRGPQLQLAALVLGVVVSAVAWFYLVTAAINFGVLAVAGQTVAWGFTLASSLGAVVCLMLFLALVARVLRALGLISEYKPRRAAAKRRAR